VKSRFLAFAWATLIGSCLLVAGGVKTFAQEGEPVVVDEVIAQVNNDVVTLSMIKREMKEAIEGLKQKGLTDEQANAEIARRRPELIASIVDEQLLMQKGKELNLTDEVEAEVNKRMLDLAKEHGIKTIESLDDAMRQSGVDPVAFRQSARSGIMTGLVLNREVDAKIYYGLRDDEVKKYYEAHKEQFRKPESITLSEIFLSFAGKPQADVLARATALVAQARKPGADFTALAVANSEREQGGVRMATQTKGKLGTVQVSDLNEQIGGAVKSLPSGGISEPIRTDDGYIILRVDERTAAGNAAFNENQVREAMTAERSAKERKDYMQKLRGDAYIKLAESYRATVGPLLSTSSGGTTADASSPTSTAKQSTAPVAEKSSGKKLKIGGAKRP
jgi:peptidyl-prolyl cis-trans isomerase SurA